MSETSRKVLLNPPKTPGDFPSPGGLASTLGSLLARPAASLRDYCLLASAILLGAGLWLLLSSAGLEAPKVKSHLLGGNKKPFHSLVVFLILESGIEDTIVSSWLWYFVFTQNRNSAGHPEENYIE